MFPEDYEVSGLVKGGKYIVTERASVKERHKVKLAMDPEFPSFHTHPEYTKEIPRGVDLALPSRSDIMIYFDNYDKMYPEQVIISKDYITNVRYCENCLTFAKTASKYSRASLDLYFYIVGLLFMDREYTKFTKQLYNTFVLAVDTLALYRWALDNCTEKYLDYLNIVSRQTICNDLEFLKDHRVQDLKIFIVFTRRKVEESQSSKPRPLSA